MERLSWEFFALSLSRRGRRLEVLKAMSRFNGLINVSLNIRNCGSVLFSTTQIPRKLLHAQDALNLFCTQWLRKYWVNKYGVFKNEIEKYTPLLCSLAWIKVNIHFQM